MNETDEVQEAQEEVSLEECEKALKPRQRSFIQKYEELGNATQAVMAAGFTDKNGQPISKESAAVIGSRLLRNVKVLAYMHAYTRFIFNTKNICKESLVLKALRVYEQSIEGTQHESFDVKSMSWKPDGTWTFAGRSAVGAIDMIAKLTGLSEQKIKIVATGNVEQYLKDLETGETPGGEF